jgi:hypothetical protein
MISDINKDSNTNPKTKPIFKMKLFLSVLLILGLGILTYKILFQPPAPDESSAPPRLELGGELYKGSIEASSGFYLYTQEDVDAFVTPTETPPETPAIVNPGAHYYYSETDISVQEIFDNIEPVEYNRILIAFYLPVDADFAYKGMHVYPQGPYLDTTTITDLSKFTIPAYHGFFILSTKETEIYGVKGETDFADSFTNEDLKAKVDEIGSGWVLLPVPPDTTYVLFEKDKVQGLFIQKGEDEFEEVVSSIYILVGGEDPTESKEFTQFDFTSAPPEYALMWLYIGVSEQEQEPEPEEPDDLALSDCTSCNACNDCEGPKCDICKTCEECADMPETSLGGPCSECSNCTETADVAEQCAECIGCGFEIPESPAPEPGEIPVLKIEGHGWSGTTVVAFIEWEKPDIEVKNYLIIHNWANGTGKETIKVGEDSNNTDYYIIPIKFGASEKLYITNLEKGQIHTFKIAIEVGADTYKTGDFTTDLIEIDLTEGEELEPPQEITGLTLGEFVPGDTNYDNYFPLSWDKPPAEDNITGYEITTYGEAAGTFDLAFYTQPFGEFPEEPFFQLIGENSAEIYNLPGGDSYTFSIKAINEYGESDSNGVGYTRSNPFRTVEISDSGYYQEDTEDFIYIQWEKPFGEQVLSYSLEHYDGFTTHIPIIGTVESLTDYDLIEYTNNIIELKMYNAKPAQTHTISVAITNNSGTGDFSEIVTVDTPPDPVTKLTGEIHHVEGSIYELKLTWTPPEGQTVTEYQFEYLSNTTNEISTLPTDYSENKPYISLLTNNSAKIQQIYMAGGTMEIEEIHLYVINNNAKNEDYTLLEKKDYTNQP